MLGSRNDYIHALPCSLSITVGEPDTEEASYHMYMCSKYNKEPAFSIGMRYQFIRCVMDLIRSIDAYMTSISRSIYLNPSYVISAFL